MFVLALSFRSPNEAGSSLGRRHSNSPSHRGLTSRNLLLLRLTTLKQRNREEEGEGVDDFDKVHQDVKQRGSHPSTTRQTPLYTIVCLGSPTSTVNGSNSVSDSKSASSLSRSLPVPTPCRSVECLPSPTEVVVIPKAARQLSQRLLAHAAVHAHHKETRPTGCQACTRP